MGHRSETSLNSIEQVARIVGRYQPAAYEFVREGLEHASRTLHGPMTPAQYLIVQYISRERIELDEVRERLARGQLDPAVEDAIEQAGGLERLNRNVSGADLCWSLRDLAVQKWSVLASLVLNRWGITKTDDFGEIVFALVEHGHLQKEERDSRDDFMDVFDFRTGFDVTLPKPCE